MGGKALLIAVVVTCAAAVAGAREAPPRPDMDLLEYLGTFETAGGKAVDPMELREMPPPNKSLQRPAPDRKSREKKKTEKKPGKDTGDE